jgi:CRP/FNR family nitrogen fixation transcriptional regulator
MTELKEDAAMTAHNSLVKRIDPSSQDLRSSSRRDLAQLLESLATMRRCHRGQEIYGQEDSAECWYNVVSGVLRRFAVRPDGRRQITDFLLPGDFFGFASGREHHVFAVEALTKSVVACYPRRRIEMLAACDPLIAQLLRQKMFDAMGRLQAQLRILGRTRAPEKVGSFLLDMAARCACGQTDNLVLPMSRYDIADYLALSVETVSRAMTDLQQRGAIALAGTRRVTIVDRHAFQEPDNDDLPGPMHPTTAAGHGARPRDATWRVTRSTSPGHTTGDPTVDITARRIASAR